MPTSARDRQASSIPCPLKGMIYIMLLMLAGIGGTTSCAHHPNIVTGRITPEHFQFKTVVKLRGSQPGGWQAVCIHARMRNGTTKETSLCRFEVGLPMKTQENGLIDYYEAQQASADLANLSAHAVLSQAKPGDMTFTLCSQFKVVYEQMLNSRFKGARVGECKTAGIKTVVFDVPIGGQ